MAILGPMLRLTRRNPTQAHHFTANQQEKCSISCARIRPAEKQTETKRECNVYLTPQKRCRLRTSSVYVYSVCAGALNKGSQEVTLLYHFKMFCQHITEGKVRINSQTRAGRFRWSVERDAQTHKCAQPFQLLLTEVCQHLTTGGPPERRDFWCVWQIHKKYF